MRTKNGFSLIEVLIVISILGVIGVITSGILSRSFNARTQSYNLSTLRQNGDLAIKIMDETIRSSEAVVCYGPTGQTRKTSIVVRTQLGKYIKFRFIDGTSSLNGYIIKQENLNPVDFNTFCDLVIAVPAEVPLTNLNTVTGVSVSDGQFSKIAGVTGKDTVTISFTVNPTLKSPSTLFSESVKIQTTVQIR